MIKLAAETLKKTLFKMSINIFVTAFGLFAILGHITGDFDWYRTLFISVTATFIVLITFYFMIYKKNY